MPCWIIVHWGSFLETVVNKLSRKNSQDKLPKAPYSAETTTESGKAICGLSVGTAISDGAISYF